MSDEQEVEVAEHDVEFEIALGIAYHGSRQTFFVSMHRWMMFAAVIFGASAASSFGGEKLCALLAAVCAAGDIAFDFTGRAQVHSDFRRRYFEMLTELAEKGAVEKLGPRVIAITTEAPPTHRIVWDIAHRNACISLKRGVVSPLPPLRYRLAAHIWRG